MLAGVYTHINHADPDFWKLLQLKKRGSRTGDIEGIHDGQEHKKHTTFLSKPWNVSLLLNTDSVAILNPQNTLFGPSG